MGQTVIGAHDLFLDTILAARRPARHGVPSTRKYRTSTLRNFSKNEPKANQKRAPSFFRKSAQAS